MKLAEVFVTLLLGLLLTTLVWRDAAVIRTTLAGVAEQTARTEARRVIGLVLDAEAGGFVEGGAPAGQVAVRAHRWWGVVCDTLPRAGRATLLFQGLRRPDPDKDSLLVVSAGGRVEVRRLDGVRAVAGCGATAVEVAWAPHPDEPPPRLVRGFEYGVYLLDEAFRYRRGSGGAQPLTAAVFHPDSVQLAHDTDGVVLRVGDRPPRRWWWRPP